MCSGHSNPPRSRGGGETGVRNPACERSPGRSIGGATFCVPAPAAPGSAPRQNRSTDRIHAPNVHSAPPTPIESGASRHVRARPGIAGRIGQAGACRARSGTEQWRDRRRFAERFDSGRGRTVPVRQDAGYAGEFRRVGGTGRARVGAAPPPESPGAHRSLRPHTDAGGAISFSPPTPPRGGDPRCRHAAGESDRTGGRGTGAGDKRDSLAPAPRPSGPRFPRQIQKSFDSRYIRRP